MTSPIVLPPPPPPPPVPPPPPGVVAAATAARPAAAAADAKAPGRPQVLLLAPDRSLTFVEHDVSILARSFGVEVLSRRDLPSRRQLLPAVARRLASRRFRLLFVWFADPYDTPAVLALARFFGVPSALVVGGYEMASLPALGYGALCDRRQRRRVELALARADVLLPTSELLAAEVRALGGALGRGHRVRMIPPGIDCGFFHPGPGRRERLVVTVGTVGEATWKVKGLDLFAACSRRVPNARFAILGPCEDEALAGQLRQLGGANLEIPGRRLTPAELRGWYQRAAVYAQLSRRESFGVAMAEAMACECVPVAARSGALPWVAGGSGRLVWPGRVGEAARAIVHALAEGPCPQARQQIERRFGTARREGELTALLRTLIASRGRQLPPEASP